MAVSISELGAIKSIDSEYEVSLCHYGPDKNQITVMINGKIVGNTGDYIVFYSKRIVNLRDGVFAGEMSLVRGSGEFNGISGTIITEGSLNKKDGTMTWRGEGDVHLLAM